MILTRVELVRYNAICQICWSVDFTSLLHRAQADVSILERHLFVTRIYLETRTLAVGPQLCNFFKLNLIPITKHDLYSCKLYLGIKQLFQWKFQKCENNKILVGFHCCSSDEFEGWPKRCGPLLSHCNLDVVWNSEKLNVSSQNFRTPKGRTFLLRPACHLPPKNLAKNSEKGDTVELPLRGKEA